MKKRIAFLLLAVLLLLSGCQADGSFLRPKKFSKETQEILDTIGDTYFYDLNIGDDLQAYTVDYWSFDGQEWNRVNLTYDTQLTQGTTRFGFHVQDEGLVIYSDKATTTMHLSMRSAQSGSIVTSQVLTDDTEIQPGEDIVLYSYIASSGLFPPNWFGDFENPSYDVGTALTITFYDHPLEF